MPYYEFECDYCGYVSEEFYRLIPRIDPIQINKKCGNCKKDTSHKKLISLSAFHLKAGSVPWGEGKISSVAQKGDEVVAIEEP